MLFDDGFDPIEDARAASSRRSLRRSWAQLRRATAMGGGRRPELSMTPRRPRHGHRTRPGSTVTRKNLSDGLHEPVFRDSELRISAKLQIVCAVLGGLCEFGAEHHVA